MKNSLCALQKIKQFLSGCQTVGFLFFLTLFCAVIVLINSAVYGQDVIEVIEVGENPDGVAVNPETNKIYVTNQKSNSVSVIDGFLNKVTATVNVELTPIGVGVNTKNNMVYVANGNSNTVSVIDGNTNNVVNTIQVGRRPHGVGINPETNRVYVVNSAGKGDVSVIDGNTNKVIDNILLGNTPEEIVINEKTNIIYVTESILGFVFVIDGATHKKITTFRPGDGTLRGIGVNPTTNQIFAARSNNKSGNIDVADGITNLVVKTFKVGVDPTSIGVFPATNRIYVTNTESDSVSIIDVTTGNIKTIEVGKNPLGVGVNTETNRIYAANSNSNNVMVLEDNREVSPEPTPSGTPTVTPAAAPTPNPEISSLVVGTVVDGNMAVSNNDNKLNIALEGKGGLVFSNVHLQAFSVNDGFSEPQSIQMTGDSLANNGGTNLTEKSSGVYSGVIALFKTLTASEVKVWAVVKTKTPFLETDWGGHIKSNGIEVDNINPLVESSGKVNFAENTVNIQFNEGMNAKTLLAQFPFIKNNSDGTPIDIVGITVESDKKNAIYDMLQTPNKTDVYTVNFDSKVTDDAGNHLIDADKVGFDMAEFSGTSTLPTPIPIHTPIPTATATPIPDDTPPDVTPPGTEPTVTPNPVVGTTLVANFTADPKSGKAPLTVRFTDQSEGGPESWNWNFGDGSRSAEQNPLHTYTAPNPLGSGFPVKLTVTNKFDSDSKTKKDFIGVEPGEVSSTETPEPSTTPEITPTPESPKSFTFKCKNSFQKGPAGLEILFMELGNVEHCILKLDRFEPNAQIEIKTFLREGFSPSIKVDSVNDFTDINGELEFTITAIDTGVDWIAWAVPNEDGKFEFNKKAFNNGLAWGMFVEVE